MMWKSLLLVGAGSFLGGVLRYGVSLLLQRWSSAGFPWGTLVVNLLGSFLIGCLFAYFSRHSSLSSPFYLLLVTGFCGGFTTFSTFAHEGLQLLQSGQVVTFLAYVSFTLVLGMLLVGLGYFVVR